MKRNCPICNSENSIPIFKHDLLPIYNNERHYCRESALNAKTGKVDFYFCKDCSFMYNRVHDNLLMDYLVDYEVSRKYSQYFNNFLETLCSQINEFYSLKGKTIVEIGCGDGQFLSKLRDLYDFEGYGFEPSMKKRGKNSAHNGIQFIADYYIKNCLRKKVDLIILRHVLEHQGYPVNFLKNVVNEKEGFIYTEVPALEWIIDNDQIVAFSYEHCSYFSMNSFKLVHKLNGFECDKLSFTFENEYLQFFGSKACSTKVNKEHNSDCNYFSKYNKIENLIIGVTEFTKRIPIIKDRLKSYFTGREDKTVLWGAGGKGLTLLFLLGIYHYDFPYVVDINQERHGTYVPLTGQKIIAPEELKRIQPETILITNSSYLHEIKRTLNTLNLKSDIQVVK